METIGGSTEPLSALRAVQSRIAANTMQRDELMHERGAIVFDLLTAGIPASTIAETLNISPQAIYQIRDRWTKSITPQRKGKTA